MLDGLPLPPLTATLVALLECQAADLYLAELSRKMATAEVRPSRVEVDWLRRHMQAAEVRRRMVSQALRFAGGDAANTAEMPVPA